MKTSVDKNESELSKMKREALEWIERYGKKAPPFISVAVNAFPEYSTDLHPVDLEQITESTLSSGWQVCPKCKGQGSLWFPPGLPWNETYLSSGTTFECDVCNGKKIISLETGLPPNNEKQ